MSFINTSTNHQAIKETSVIPEIYEGKLTFCYTSCLSMLLKNKNIDLSISYLENLTTCSFGFFYQRHQNYFELFISDLSPDRGLIFAGQTLGFEVIQKDFENFSQAKKYLDEILVETPVILGPVNLGTMPNHKFKNIPPGADHYIVALSKINDFEYYINDPEGFIEIPLTEDELNTIWEGREIPYTDSKYILTYLGKRLRTPSRLNIFKTVLDQILKNLQDQELDTNFSVGSGVIDKFIADFKADRYQNIRDILAGFQLEMNNQRSYVSGIFLKNHRDIHPLIDRCSAIRFEQAKLFGRARIITIKGSDEDLIEILKKVSQLEKEFHRLIQKIHDELHRA